MVRSSTFFGELGKQQVLSMSHHRFPYFWQHRVRWVVPTDREKHCSLCQRFYGTIEHQDEEPEWPLRLPCDHHFGHKCLEQYFSSELDSRNTCPICRCLLYKLPPDEEEEEEEEEEDTRPPQVTWDDIEHYSSMQFTSADRVHIQCATFGDVMYGTLDEMERLYDVAGTVEAHTARDAIERHLELLDNQVIGADALIMALTGAANRAVDQERAEIMQGHPLTHPPQVGDHCNESGVAGGGAVIQVFTQNPPFMADIPRRYNEYLRVLVRYVVGWGLAHYRE